MLNIFEQANTWLQRLNVWLNANKLQLNVSKTKYLLFKSKGMHTPSQPQLQFQKINIEQSSTAKFLGVIFHENMSWSPHIDSLKTSIARAVGALNRLRYLLPTSVKHHIYSALVHSRLTYCLLVWSTTTQYNLGSLQTLQNRALRAIENLGHMVSTKTYYCKYKIFSVQIPYI